MATPSPSPRAKWCSIGPAKSRRCFSMARAAPAKRIYSKGCGRRFGGTKPIGNRVVYLSAEQFTTQFLEALKGSGLPNFRQKYRRADMLLLDDVQFFAGKRATITEVQNTVDEMLRQGRQVVMAADRPPAQLAELGTALTTRLSSGMVCALQPGNQQMRLAIARQMCASRRLEIPTAVLQYIAQHMPGDARHFAGAINRLQATSLALGRSIDLQLARERARRSRASESAGDSSGRRAACRVRSARHAIGRSAAQREGEVGEPPADARHVSRATPHAGGPQRNRRALRPPQSHDGRLGPERKSKPGSPPTPR